MIEWYSNWNDWDIDARIELYLITTEDLEKASNQFAKEIVDT